MRTTQPHSGRESDPRGVRAVAWSRVLASTSAALVCAFLPAAYPSRMALQLLTAVLWVPWSGLLAMASESRFAGLVRRAGAASDFAVVFTVQLLVRGIGALALVAYALAVVAGGYMSDRRTRVAVGLAALGLAFTGNAIARPDVALGASVITSFVVLVVALVVLLDRTATERAVYARRSAVLEGKSAAIIDHVADGVVVTDAGGVVRQWNRPVSVIAACPASEAVGRRCSDVLGLHLGDEALDCSRGCALLATAASSPLGQEVWRERQDGRRQPLLANVSAVADDRGGVVEVVHSLRDITRLKQADEAKAIFLATASHELKTPLTVIGGFAETLLDGRALREEDKLTALTAIKRRAQELGRIVDRMLLSSRIESGRADVRRERVPLVPLVTERVESYAASTGRPVTLDTGDDVPDVAADAEAVVTVVDHLIDNALKYSPGGEPVRVAIGAGDGVATVSVSDSGVGMDVEAMGHCFEPFWQAESTDVRRFGGTGIGLYIVRSLALAMGGDASVESQLNRGTTFRIDLPVWGEDARPKRPEYERSMVREFMRQIGATREKAAS